MNGFPDVLSNIIYITFFYLVCIYFLYINSCVNAKGSVKPRLSTDCRYQPSTHPLSTGYVRVYTEKFMKVMRSSVYMLEDWIRGFRLV